MTLTVLSVLALFAPLLLGAFAGGIMALILLVVIFIYLSKTDKIMRQKGLIVALIGALIAVGLVVNIRFFSGEDDWICDKGNWIQHGKPSAPKPTGICR